MSGSKAEGEGVGLGVGAGVLTSGTNGGANDVSLVTIGRGGGTHFGGGPSAGGISGSGGLSDAHLKLPAPP